MKVLESRKKLGKGELSSLALAMRIGQAFITDDMKARRLATEAGHDRTQTTAHLFGWLIFVSRLTDHDKVIVIREHEELGRPLRPHLEKAYEMALQCRLNVR